METFDLAVIGAGPAGSTLAGRAAAHGLRVLLLERSSFPREKLCGEFLSPEARVYLAGLGLERAAREAGAVEITHLKVAVGGRTPLLGELPRAGLGLSRRTLDTLVARWAVAQGAVFLERHHVREVREIPGASSSGRGLFEIRATVSGEQRFIRARAVADASGMGSGLAGPRGRGREPARFLALQRYYRPSDLAGGSAALAADGALIELYPFRGGYCGVNSVEGGRINLCLLAMRGAGGRNAPVGGGAAVAAALPEASARENAHLAARLAQLTPLETRFRAAAFTPDVLGKRAASGKGPRAALLAVGDASAMIAPACGDGISMAMRSGELACEELVSWLAKQDAWSRCLADYRARWRSEFATRLQAGRMLHAMLVRPELASLVVSLARAFPPLTGWLFRRTREWKRVS